MTTAPRALTLPGGAPLLAFGPMAGPQILVLQPLFEEMNRCRALVAALCRTLSTRGLGCWLPDLPGTGEDMRALGMVSWADWRGCILEAMALIASESGREATTVAIRGGALLDEATSRRWRLSPVSGASLVRDLARAGLTGEEMAGYRLAAPLRDALAGAEPVAGAGTRTVRLVGDERAADARIDGPALWRRSEPAADAAFAARLADDVAGWAVA